MSGSRSACNQRGGREGEGRGDEEVGGARNLQPGSGGWEAEGVSEVSFIHRFIYFFVRASVQTFRGKICANPTCGQHSSSCCLLLSSFPCSPLSHSLHYSSGVSPLLAPLGQSRAQLSPSFISRPTATRAVRLLRQGHIQNTKGSSVKPALHGIRAPQSSQSSTNPYFALTKMW